MSVVVLVLLASSISIGFVLGRMSNDDRPPADTRRRKAPRVKTSVKPS